MAPEGSTNDANTNANATATMNGEETEGADPPSVNENGDNNAGSAAVPVDNASSSSTNAASSASDEMNNDSSPPKASIAASTNENFSTSTSTTTTTTTNNNNNTPTRTGFFTRHLSTLNSTTSYAAASEVYERAQKRATLLKEQAVTEVERLRQTQLERAQKDEEEKCLRREREIEKGFMEGVSSGRLIVDGDKVSVVDHRVVVDHVVEEEFVHMGMGNNNSSGGGGGRKEATVETVARDLEQTTMQSISSAINIVRQTSTEAAKELIFPMDAFGAPKDDDHEMQADDALSPNSSNVYSSYSHNGSHVGNVVGSNFSNRVAAEEENASVKKDEEVNGTTDIASNNDHGASAAAGASASDSEHATATPNATSTPTAMGAMTPTRFSAATNSVFNATLGRYRRLKESASFDDQPHSQPSSTKSQELIVGGADRVGGLRHFQLDGILDGSSAGTMVLGGSGGGSNRMPPPPSPGRDNPSAPNAFVRSSSASTDHHHHRGALHAPIAFSRALSAGDANSSRAASETSEEAAATTAGTGASKPRHDNSSKLPPSSSNGKQPRTSYYEQAVRSVLQPGQRALFFGKGTMGVVLKPTYLASWRGKDGGSLLCPSLSSNSKKGGVFIDSLVPGGHAEKSGVVFVGDAVLKIGSVDVRNMTLEDVVTVILETKRPNIMVFSGEHDVELVESLKDDDAGSLEDGSEGMGGKNKRLVSPLDMAFGIANKLAAEGGVEEDAKTENGYELKPVISTNSLLDNDDDEDDESVEDHGGIDDGREEEVSFNSPGKAVPQSQLGDFGSADNARSNKPESRVPTTQAQVNPTNTMSIDIDILYAYASHRTNTLIMDDTTETATATQQQHTRTSQLKRAALFHPRVRNALHLSLVECTRDPRRFSFLEHYFKNYQSKKEMDKNVRNGGRGANKVDDNNDVTSSKNQRQLLELYMELCQFHNAMRVCSVSDREKLLDYAKAISTRFLLEENNGSNKYCLPEHVAHVALGGMEQVQAVRFALRDEDEFFEMGNNNGDGDNDGDGFHSIRSSLEAFLATQESFLSFLISDDCARMRAYLRGSSPFLRVEPCMFLKCSNNKAEANNNAEEDDGGSNAAASHNFLSHAILHLLCMTDDDDEGKHEEVNFIKNDALLLNSGKRNMGAASQLGCAIYINRTLQKAMEAAVEGLIEDGMTAGGGTSTIDTNLKVYLHLIESLQFFWEVYVAPAGGSLSSLSLSLDVQEALDDVRRLLVSSVDQVSLAEENTTLEVDSPIHNPTSAASAAAMAKMLSSVDVSSSVHGLAEALLRDYTLKIYPNFQRHIFHEWASKEAIGSRFDGGTGSNSNLSKGWMNRFLRQMEFPDGISLHRPGPSAYLSKDTDDNPTTMMDTPTSFHNGDVALVFGSETGDEAAVQRFSCVSLQPETTEDDGPRKKVLLPEDIPPIFESYAVVPPFHERPFQGMLQDVKNNRISIDGWEVSLTNFVIPSQASGGTDDDGKWSYCVSLVFRKSSTARPQMSEREIDNECVGELQHEESASGEATATNNFQSPLFATESEDGQSRKMKVSKDLKEFNSKLQQQKWSQQTGQGATIGLTLISSRNVTHAMRETLSLLYDDFCSVKSPSEGMQKGKTPRYLCQALVDILGVLSHSQEVEAASLSCLLQPYLAYTTSRWVHRPLSDQSDIFSEASGMQLLQALPPVPLALAFVTLLLEQKVVFSSSRRGMLMSASFAMMQLLKPLKWAHLHVPLVPVSMMNELVHYPAPFLLGIPTDEKESAAILSTLPSDVTLVDLDVGRVILASEFANDASKSAEGASGEAVAGALRSQALFLAESLGGAFGAAIYRNSWCSDSPLQVMPSKRGVPVKQSVDNFSQVLGICEDFVSELLAGIHSCCLLIEEKHDQETTNRGNESVIIFDEDHFFHIKNLRAEGRYMPLIQKPDDSTNAKFSLSLDHFDLIFEIFLRTQCLSTYISDGNKEAMLFS
mmetsp:Transcript_7437/g.16861  ORF Transcript_7437/g.16861 Transcript_7437/m.16861 type:complete len:1957 (+) Transcript_7437:3-5873(+)